MSTRYRWTLLRAGAFRLDGGSMFGCVPRVVWSRQVKADERGRIGVQHNCLLLERADEPARGPGGASALPAPKIILIETGTGNKLDAASRDLFAMEERSILDALHEGDCRPEDVGGVIVSHLHFDHAGGLTRLCRAGESPDWTGPASCFAGARGEHGVKRTFPGAVVVTQARELADALANRSVMTRTYFADHVQAMAPHLRAVDSPRPFAPGLVLDRDADPLASVDVRQTEVFPGVFVFLVPGHTWGQQAVRFTDDRGRTVVFTPDVMPTAAHAGPAYSLGYDVEPYTSMVSRRWLLAEAAAGGWTLVLDHEEGPPMFTVAPNGRGWFELRAAE